MLRINTGSIRVASCEFAGRCLNAETRKGRSDCPFIEVLTGPEQFSPAAKLGLKPKKVRAVHYINPDDPDAQLTAIELCDAAQGNPRIIHGLLTLLSGIEPNVFVKSEDLPSMQEVDGILSGGITDADQVTSNLGFAALEKLTDGVRIDPDRGLAVQDARLVVVNVYDLS